MSPKSILLTEKSAKACFNSFIPVAAKTKFGAIFANL